ncbi:WD repeat, SAM and U-box domain-containing protein 1-like isoform X2 [Montipora capricornis]|uniref:WD repeat, SAM and U-box domain-containing protein 1-like isoform X2 n=1 Tax=Montipora capricornis TaxID=246305 RepID=UPI0035F1BA21
MSVLVNTFSKHAKDVTSCSFSPNSKIFASSSGDKTVRLWNVADGTELSMSPLLGHSYGVNSCHFSPFGTLLATASTDGNVHLWDVNTGSVIAVLQGHKSGVRVCRFSPNSRFLVSGSTDETFCIWDVSSKKLVKCTEKLESSVMTCCFTPDSMHIVAGTSFGDLSVWEVQSGKMMKFLAEGHDLGVTDCCFSPNFGSANPAFHDTSGSAPHFLLASGGNDNLVTLWDIFTASAFSEDCHIRKRCSLSGHQGPVYGVAMSPNGKILASGSGDKFIILWDPLAEVLLVSLEGHTRYVTCCGFSLDGNWLTTGSNDKTVKLWKICLTETAAILTLIMRPHPASMGCILSVCLSGSELDQSGGCMLNKSQLEKPRKTMERAKTQEPRKKLATWSTDDVCRWLTSLDLELYGESFRQNAIDGEELSHINSEVLASDLSIGPAGHRNKILRMIKEIKRQELEEDIPDEFFCPITREIMCDPVIAADGYTYERASIEEWLKSGRKSSPMTNAPLKTTTLTPNRMLKNLIQNHFNNPLSVSS